MSYKLDKWTDEELVENYREMQHLAVDVSSSKGIGDLALYQGLVREMARRFAELIESNEEPEEAADEHEEIKMIMGDDGIFRRYNDEFDIIIHCESQEEQNRVQNILNQEYVSKEDIDEAIAEIMRSDIPLDYVDENERAAFADGQGDALSKLKELLWRKTDDKGI